MNHAEQRLYEREPQLSAIPALWERLARMAADGRAKAVWLARLPYERGERYGSNASNGDCLWAILRNGEVATIMRRRRTQPSTTQALRVDEVCWSLVA